MGLGLENDLALSVLVLECRRVSALRGRKASGLPEQPTASTLQANDPNGFNLKPAKALRAKAHDGSSLAALNSTSRGSECFFDKGRFRCRFVFFLVGSFHWNSPFVGVLTKT